MPLLNRIDEKIIFFFKKKKKLVLSRPSSPATTTRHSTHSPSVTNRTVPQKSQLPEEQPQQQQLQQQQQQQTQSAQQVLESFKLKLSAIQDNNLIKFIVLSAAIITTTKSIATIQSTT